MNAYTLRAFSRAGFLKVLAAAAIMLSAYSGAAFGDEISVALSGDKEVPPVTTKASGSGVIKINEDMTVTGSITTTGIAGMMAHIHQGVIGANGPVIIPLYKSGDSTWVVPDGARLTEAQYKAYKAGALYINVHSAANMSGEIRGQLK